MQIAQVLAGYTLGGADLLRRAMGKKKPRRWPSSARIFVTRRVARGVAQPRAAYIFDLMEKFAGYGFNKSHSAAYALLVLPDRLAEGPLPGRVHGRGAVRGHGPDRQGRDADRRMHELGLKVLPPDVNASRHKFAVADDAQHPLRHGRDQGRRRGRGGGADRGARGARPVSDLEDLCRRIDLARVNRRVLEALINPAVSTAWAPIAPR